ncbi:SAF domain-containing protein, partial [Pantoea vagans]
MIYSLFAASLIFPLRRLFCFLTPDNVRLYMHTPSGGRVKYDNDNEIRALVGAVVSDLIKAGEPVHFHDITDA